MNAPIAAIDLGTNTVLLLVARRGPDGALEVLHDESVTARLGEGLARTGRLDDAALERTLDVLGRFLATARERGVATGDLRAVGTAVLRRAADAPRFLAAARERLALAVEVLSEEDEARLGHAAVSADGGGPDTVVVDVGGGSTEVVTDAGATRLSAPVGAVVLTERWLGLGGRPPTQPGGGWGALVAEVADACGRFPAGAAAGRDVVLLGGTAANLACLAAEAPCFDPGAVEGARLAAAEAGRWAERLRALPPEERRALPIEADRAEILPAGLVCLAAALARLGAGQVRVSGRGLRYGVARELLAGTERSS